MGSCCIRDLPLSEEEVAQVREWFSSKRSPSECPHDSVISHEALPGEKTFRKCVRCGTVLLYRAEAYEQDLVIPESLGEMKDRLTHGCSNQKEG